MTTQPINDMHQKIIDEFFSISHAARKLGFKSRKSLYDLIHNGMNPVARSRIIAHGYNPETFKPQAQINVQNNAVS